VGRDEAVVWNYIKNQGKEGQRLEQMLHRWGERSKDGPTIYGVASDPIQPLWAAHIQTPRLCWGGWHFGRTQRPSLGIRPVKENPHGLPTCV